MSKLRKDKKENKIKTIIKFTFKNTFKSKIYILTNILMIFVVIFLTRVVSKLALSMNNNELNFLNEEIVQTETIEEEANDFYRTSSDSNYSSNSSNQQKQITNNVAKMFNMGFVISFILFFTIYFYGYMVSNSVSEEKTSRLIENLLMSVSPKEIVFGKTIAMGYLGMLQMLELVITFIITAIVTLKIDVKSIIDNVFNFNLNFSLNFNFNMSNMTLFLEVLLVVLIMFLYFIFGYLFYAFICAIAGAGVDKAEDVQMVNGPISILAMIGFYFSVLSSSMPDNKWAPLTKYLPFSSAFSMPVNIINGTTNMFEMITSLIILILSSLWLGMIAIKVYRYVIFNYGKKTTMKDILKIIFLTKEEK